MKLSGRLFPPGSAAALLLSLVALLAFLPAARAQLVWDPATGWRVAGGALTLLSEEDNREAVDLMNEARRAQDDGRQKRAFKRYEEVAKDFPRSIYAPEALFQAGRLRLERRQYTKAFSHFVTVATRYPGYGKFDEILRFQFDIADALASGRRPLIWGWLPTFRNRARGLEFFEAIVSIAPYNDLAPEALMRAADGYLRRGDADSAIDALHRFVNIYPSHERAPEAFLKLAQTHASLVSGPRYDQGSTREALSYFEDFLILFPNDPRVGEGEKGVADMRTVLARSKIELGDWYFRYRSNYRAARVFYNEAITTYPESEIAATARTKLETVDAAEARRAANPPSGRWRWISWLWR